MKCRLLVVYKSKNVFCCCFSMEADILKFELHFLLISTNLYNVYFHVNTFMKNIL